MFTSPWVYIFNVGVVNIVFVLSITLEFKFALAKPAFNADVLKLLLNLPTKSFPNLLTNFRASFSLEVIPFIAPWTKFIPLSSDNFDGEC